MRPLLVSLAILLLAACGGGGHSNGDGNGHRPVTTDPTPLEFPLQAGADTGIEQTGDLNRLLVVGERGSIMIRHGALVDGVGRSAVVTYLEETAEGGTVWRPTSAWSLRVIGPSTAREREIVASAVEAINLSLPPAYRIQIESPAPQLSLGNTITAEGRYNYWTGDPLSNTIHVEFLPCEDYVKCGRAAATAWGLPDHGYVQIVRGTTAYHNDDFAEIVMAHELLHTIGIHSHVQSASQSIMRARVYQDGGPASILFPIDREVLQALYRQLEPGDAPTSLGPWARSSLHVAGNGFHANFGVALRNGYAEPWAHGPMPRTTLANNRSLSGSATWTGALLGLTPAAEAVAGDAAIIVDLLALTGSTSFVALESWAAGAAPGAAGTGTTWLDGDLDYTIAVRGNTFRETGGDDGTLTGIFTGAAHEGAAGTLERADLTAAFGASR